MQKKTDLRNLVTAAVFAAAIAATTAYVLHIPLPTGGYVHVGDALIYLAACLLPLPWAMAAGAERCGGGRHRACFPTLYGFVNVFFAQTWTAFWPQFLGTLIQGVGSGVVFAVLAFACDKAGLKKRLEAN